MLTSGVLFGFVAIPPESPVMEGRMRRGFLNGSIIYETPDGAPVTERKARQEGLTEQELYEAAYRNTMCACVPKITNISKLIAAGKEKALHVKTQNGRPVLPLLLYSDFLASASRSLGGDVLAIPMSEYDIVIVRASNKTAGIATQMAKEAGARFKRSDMCGNMYLYLQRGRTLAMIPSSVKNATA